MSTAIENALAEKNRSGELSAQARQLILADELNRGLELLEKAHSIYGKDPVLSINLGLAWYHTGEFEKAREVLASAAAYVAPAYLRIVCFANLAFAAIQSSDFDLAMSMLDSTMIQLKRGTHGQESPSLWDLPGIANWVGQGDQMEVSEERPDSALSLIEYAMEHLEEKKQVPDNVRDLAELYRKSVSLYQTGAGEGKKWWWPFG